MNPVILIAEDERNTREGLKWTLEDKAQEILLAADGQAALEFLREREVDLLITDLKMPKLDGIELLKRARRESPETEVVVLTAHATVETAVDAMKMEARDYLMKPVNPEELRLLVDRVFADRRMRRENQALREEIDVRYGFDNIIGSSAAMVAVFKRVRLVAPARSSVLISGESGTGKELIASAIHFNSPRRGSPFVKINCGALTPTLLESELFGHERGAFTHAIKTKPGSFELADGGTLFLDEITETSADFQIKLLRVLQEHEVVRVGGTRPLRVDVRILAASNRDIEESVRSGRLREDLYYRLNVVRIKMPPLRERREDIPLLAHAFLKEFREENGKGPLRFTPKALALLQNFDWPGNVRQLRNVIEGMVVMSVGGEISVRNLPPEIRQSEPERQCVSLPVGSTLCDAERELIRATLRQAEGNRAQTARLLGIGRKTLYRKMEEYGLE
ncbi:MAG: sigma-54 dependent transcriptional regulator [Candidatus Sumerlaeota bacterium]|nr:sigma-54 dependent transcriptional regulator [Candidatus Sumerlaeota bacterium]